MPLLHRQRSGWLVAAAAGLAVSQVSWTAPEKPAATSTSRALIVVGLPGDAENEALFTSLVGQYRDWLTKSLAFDPAEVRVLFGRGSKPEPAKGPATRAALEREVAEVREVLRPEDRLWVFFLGHGNSDGEEAFFHLAGRDVSAAQLGKLFAGIPCREQVFWMTHSASGWFLRPLSAKGRIVITATTADDEYNETEFPEALAAVVKRPADRLDTNGDGKVSVLELFRHTVAEVEARFAANQRAPTEHALLDDTGDGAGTEKPLAEGEKAEKPSADGRLAARTFLPFRTARPKD